MRILQVKEHYIQNQLVLICWKNKLRKFNVWNDNLTECAQKVNETKDWRVPTKLTDWLWSASNIWMSILHVSSLNFSPPAPNAVWSSVALISPSQTIWKLLVNQIIFLSYEQKSKKDFEMIPLRSWSTEENHSRRRNISSGAALPYWRNYRQTSSPNSIQHDPNKKWTQR